MTEISEFVYNDMTEEDLNSFRPWIKDMLKTGPVKVTFIKKDGTERVMECTLNPNLLPVETVTEDSGPKRKKAENINVLPVYDLEQKAWRSFILRSVTRVSFEF